MSTSNKILSTQLCTGITEWFKQNTYFNNTFKSFCDYLRIDFPQSEMPGISVYFEGAPNLQTNRWNEKGVIAIDVVFSLQNQRQERAKEIITTLEMVRAQLLDNPNYIQQFVSANYVPGLIFLNTTTNMRNLSNLKQKMLNAKNGSLVITFTMDYEISVYLNQKAMWLSNKDYYSPEVDIYHPIEIGEVYVNGQPSPPPPCDPIIGINCNDDSISVQADGSGDVTKIKSEDFSIAVYGYGDGAVCNITTPGDVVVNRQ